MSNPGAASTSTSVFLGGGTPWLLGNAATDKVGFYGTTPVVQASAITAVATTASTSTSSAFGYTTSTQAEAIVTAVNSLILAVHNIGITA